ncbi:MAG: hypothetical protein WBM14_14570 [Terracidiphilus sp.]
MQATMLEKINGIRNPLTIIAIFACLAEVAGTVAMAAVNKELQGTFVWFVMGFPILLVLLFFLTLNFNPKVLYAPSDFRSDDGFLDMQRSGKIIASGFREIVTQLDVAKQEIVEEAVKQVGKSVQIERALLSNIVDEQIGLIRKKMESTSKSVAAQWTSQVDVLTKSISGGGYSSTIPADGSMTMENLAASLTSEEQLGFEQLTALTADTTATRNLATFVNQEKRLGGLAVVARGATSQGTKILSTTVYVSGTKTAVDVYRLPLTN